MFSEPSGNCPLTESCEWSTATGSMPPDLRRRMHVRRTLSSSAELQGRREQTTEFDLQHRNWRRARINMQGPVQASLCTSSDSLNWMRCATGSQCSRSLIKPVTCEYFPAPQSILAAAFVWRNSCWPGEFQHGSHSSIILTMFPAAELRTGSGPIFLRSDHC